MSRNTYLRNRFVLFAAVLVKSMAAANAFSQLFQANNRLAPATRKRWCAGALFLPHVAQRQGGAKLKERRTEKVGKLQHNSTPIAGNSYWMAFSNSGRRVKTDGNGAPGRHGSAPFFPVHAGKGRRGGTGGGCCSGVAIGTCRTERGPERSQPDALHAAGNCQPPGRRQPALLFCLTKRRFEE